MKQSRFPWWLLITSKRVPQWRKHLLILANVLRLACTQTLCWGYWFFLVRYKYVTSSPSVLRSLFHPLPNKGTRCRQCTIKQRSWQKVLVSLMVQESSFFVSSLSSLGQNGHIWPLKTGKHAQPYCVLGQTDQEETCRQCFVRSADRLSF